MEKGLPGLPYESQKTFDLNDRPCKSRLTLFDYEAKDFLSLGGELDPRILMCGIRHGNLFLRCTHIPDLFYTLKTLIGLDTHTYLHRV